ncbi:GNAT family N-acetyltransferase [Antrihabitans spumae]|uniref:GNAT family N-acetyltransferase n=1 Tax=Antrihabitans spumae TaxID=3373370 RepID=A0ABW7KDG6_9NOCA
MRSRALSTPSAVSIPRAAFSQVHLGPVSFAGRAVTVRTTRYADFARWRDIRLRDRRYIEPFWLTSPLTWEERHTEAHWIRECMYQRRTLIDRRTLPLSIEVDGEFAGQCNLFQVDLESGTAELSIWLGSHAGAHGVGAMAGAMVADYAFDTLGLRRLIAPVCTDNHAAAHTAKRGGMTREATLSSFLDVGGKRRDHDLWAVTADRVPTGGLIELVLASAGNDAPKQAVMATTTKHTFTPSPPALIGLPKSRDAKVAIARFFIGFPRRLLESHPGTAGPDLLHSTGSQATAVALRSSRIADGSAWRLSRRHTDLIRPVSAELSAPILRRIPLHANAFRIRSRVALRRTSALAYALEVAGQPVGTCELRGLDPHHGTAELHVVVDWTNPLVDPSTTATGVELLLGYAFDVLRLERVAATIDAGDARAIEVASRCGLSREGTMIGAELDADGNPVDLDLWAKTSGRS